MYPICMNSDEDVAGVQFSFDPGTSGFEIENLTNLEICKKVSNNNTFIR